LLLLVLSLGLCDVDWEGRSCSNQCDTDNDTWCGERRQGKGENVFRCADLTRYGHICVTGCRSRGESYNWCRTKHHLSDSWEYCGEQGHTRYGKKCVGECAQKGKDYWWCYTQGDNWEYCSPPSEVIPVSYTINGQECVGSCSKWGEKYWWCVKSRRWDSRSSAKSSESADDYWDYCSPDSHHTRYNEPCVTDCDHGGYSYYWCLTNKKTKSWEYCSPKIEANYTHSNSGYLCVGRCHGWCAVLGGQGKNGYWDYCGASSVQKIHASLLVLILIYYLTS